MIELQTVTTKAKNPSTNEFQDVTWGGINVLSTSGTTNYNNLTNKPTINGVTVQGSLTTGDLLITAADVGALPSGTKYGADFALSIDSQTFVVTAQLKDQDGNNLGQAKTIDLPLETMVVSGSYDDTTQKIILTLKNGQTVEFSVADLVSGLQSEITLNNKLDADLVSDVNSGNKFVTTAEKAAWNGKQDTISDLSTIRSGAAAGATALQQSDITSTYSASGTAPVNGTAVNAALGSLDVASVGGTGKVISAISETDGKISATATTMDTTPTTNSTNPVTSGGVAASQAVQDAKIAWNANQGVKNLASINITSGTYIGFTVTATRETVTVESGTTAPSPTANFRILTPFIALKAGTYEITGCPATGTDSTYRLDVRYTGSSGTDVIAADYGAGKSFTLAQDSTVGIFMRFERGYTVTTPITFKPMLCLKSLYDSDNSYQPYALPNPVITPAVIKAVDEGAKNLLPENNGNGVRYWQISVSLPIGTYVVYFANMTSTDTDASTCQFATFASDDTTAMSPFRMQRAANQVGVFTTTKDTTYVRFYASDSYSHGENDTVTVTNAMICTASDWAISQKFVPYRPSWQEMWEMIQALQNNS